MAKAHRPHDEATVEMFRADPDLAAEYLNSVLTDGDETAYSSPNAQHVRQHDQ